MFAGGNLHGNGRALAAYLTRVKEGERVELAELRGFVFNDIHNALASAELQAFEKTNCEYPFFHGYMRAAPGEHLDKAQWLHCIDEYEKSLGFTGQPRAVSFHIDEQSGEMHTHIAWSRIDTEHEKYFAIDPGLYVLKGMEVARELEIELGLRRIGERDPENKINAPTRDELEEARRLKTDLKEIRETIRECWEHSDNGRSFSAALEQEGLILAQGDRRDFVVIDQEGGHHALNKGITGATAAKTRERLADLDRAQLPTVEQAQAQQLEREIAGLEKEHTVEPSAAVARGFVAALEECGLRMARASAEDVAANEHARDGYQQYVHDHPEEAKTYGIKEPPQLTPDELVVVALRNNEPQLCPLNERTTGENQDEIGKFLGAFDRANLSDIKGAAQDLREAASTEGFAKSALSAGKELIGLAGSFADFALKVFDAVVDFFITPSRPTPEQVHSRREAHENAAEAEKVETKSNQQNDERGRKIAEVVQQMEESEKQYNRLRENEPGRGERERDR